MDSVCVCVLLFIFIFPQRVTFDVTSPNGVLLFREASKIITCYGEHILTITDIPADKIYDLKYPLIWPAPNNGLYY